MFCERMRLLRNEKGMSQKEISALLGITQQSYSNYESGNREPSLSMLTTIARFHNVSVDFLLGLTDEKSPIPEGIELNKTQIEIVELLTHAPEEKQSVLLAVFQAVLSGGEGKPPADVHPAP